MKKCRKLLCFVLVFGLVITSGAFVFADDLLPIPGIPENAANAGNTNTAPIRQPGLTCNPYTVFNPEGILMDDDFGMPVRLGYRTVQEYYAEMRYLAETYPDLVKLHTYGTSKYYKWPLLALEISNNPGGNDGRPSTMHQAGNHPREWLSNEMCMDLGWYLLTQYGKKADATEILDTTTVWLIPVTNPDGVHYDQTVSGPGNWRGNLGGANGTTINSGCDINRNWPYGWGSNNGSTAGYGTGTNRGSGPESEPEIAGLTALARSNMMITGISGHQFPSGNGQYLVFPWSFFVNRTANPGITGAATKATSTPNTIMIQTPGGQIDIRDLGYQQAKFNLHSAEYSNIMYAYSGESGDYLYGTLRSLPFLYEFGRWLMQSYNGQDMNFATTSFNDLYTGKQREFLVSYSTAASAARAGMPAADVTAQMAFVTDDGFVPDYGPLTATTVADVNALGTALEGKILCCMIAANNNDNAAIAIAAQNRGAVGVLFCTRLSSLQGYQHSHYTPNLGTGTAATNNPALITIPVGGTAKQYLRELYEKTLDNPETTMTFNTGLRRLETTKWQFERNLGAFIENMYMATEYASHIKGNIKDGTGSLIPEATLNLEMQVFSPQITSGSGNWAHQITQAGVLEQTQTGVYNVAGGTFDWSVTPSKQPTNPIGINATQFPDLGYDITVTAPGKVNQYMNVSVPLYQMTVDLGDITLADTVANPKFISIAETSKNSRVWVLTFSVDVADPVTGEIEKTIVSINLAGNNANLDGTYAFDGDSPLAGYALTYDIKGNGSNIKAFSISYI